MQDCECDLYSREALCKSCLMKAFVWMEDGSLLRARTPTRIWPRSESAPRESDTLTLAADNRDPDSERTGHQGSYCGSHHSRHGRRRRPRNRSDDSQARLSTGKEADASFQIRFGSRINSCLRLSLRFHCCPKRRNWKARRPAVSARVPCSRGFRRWRNESERR
jgi:hypothetical protein